MQVLRLIFLLLISYSSGHTDPEPVKITSERDGEKVVIIAANPNPYPVTIELSMKTKNIIPGEAFPVIKILPANARDRVTVVRIADPSKSWNYETSYIFYMGDINAQHDNRFAYRLPYAINTTERVGQAYGGSFSHTGPNYYSIDFNMEEGSRVVAARSGLVVEVQEEFNEGGADRSYIQKANYITIMHDDGTFADYSHLRKNGAVVREGQQVRLGQHIGYSGATGFATGPHLHFVVKKASRGGGYESIPVKFKTKEGIITLQDRESYTAY
ncbi:M23 family metallopeptidase [Balneola sp. MJW-20]|uniref:M23 family metallopeptidase n=1 Tax=Gracilimonas aurantiaca TaxID=3234185 RepID=UPI0034668584